jgi:hypothetical protein
MRVYLAIATGERGARIPPPVLDAARRAVYEAFPIPAEAISGTAWLAPGADVALLAWSNEPPHDALPEMLRTTDTGAMGYCGYLAEPEDEDVLLRAEPLGPAVDGLGGCFSVFRAGTTGFEAATPINRVCPVYHAESAGLRFAGSRAILVHLTARAAATGLLRPEPDYDVLGLHVMIRHGFFTCDQTPFHGVSALPNSASLTVGIGVPPRIDRRPLPEQAPMPRSRAEARELVAPLAEGLLESVRPFERHDRPVRVALSGGRDSRLIAAALHGAGIPFVAATHGLPGSPDVVAATLVARALGARQDVDHPSRDDRGRVVVGHPLRRAHHVVRMCEGMVSAYESVTHYLPYEPEPRTSGSGGERLRGGFLSDQADITAEGIRHRLKTIFCAQDHLLVPEANVLARERYEQWCERAEREGMDVLDKLHMIYRTGRWLPGSHTATLMNWPYYHPYLDARVTGQAVRLPIEWRYTEEPMFLAMEALAPRLRDIPLEGRRWRFDRRPPRGVRGWGAWLRRRRQVRATEPGGVFNWRRGYDENFAAIMRDRVLSAPPELFEVADRTAVKEMLSEVPPRRPSQAWNLLTVGLLLSGAWREAPPEELPSVAIRVP